MASSWVGAKVLVVGSANLDVVVSVQRHPRPGETVLGGDTRTAPGGKGANTAVAAARLGADVALLGAVGTDAGGDVLLAALTDAGVDTALVRRVDAPSGAAYITVSEQGENAIVVSPGANAHVSARDVEAASEAIRAARVVFAVLEVPMEAVRVALAAEAGVRFVLNASPVSALEDSTMAAVDPLIVNQHEAAELLGGSDGSAAELARGLRGLGARSVVVTCGADGAVVADESGVAEVPAPAVEVVDTTGAGDAFAGALCSRLAAGYALVEAAREAVRVAADVVTRRGAQG